MRQQKPGLSLCMVLLLTLLSACNPQDQQNNQEQQTQTSQTTPDNQDGQDGKRATSSVVGNGVIKTQTLDLPAFQALDLHSGFQLVFHQNSQLSKALVKLTIDENLLSQVEAKVSDGLLNVRLTSPAQAKVKRLEITAPALQTLILQGGSIATIDKFTGLATYELELRGGSQLKIDKLDGDRLNIGLHGGSKLTLSGKVGRLEANTLAGGSYADLQDLKSTDAQLHLQGGSEARVNVSHQLDVDMAGGSKVYYAGTAQVQQHAMAGGSQVMALLMK